ncbi:unnamed protein product [Lymnaea stagnalis]|uniref:Uncharacterized protein n=1 Tax=Lymnaea stagnalis TaxID=6523 RepID=A0AAV2IJS8_LYMST
MTDEEAKGIEKASVKVFEEQRFVIYNFDTPGKCQVTIQPVQGDKEQIIFEVLSGGKVVAERKSEPFPKKKIKIKKKSWEERGSDGYKIGFKYKSDIVLGNYFDVPSV